LNGPCQKSMGVSSKSLAAALILLLFTFAVVESPAYCESCCTAPTCRVPKPVVSFGVFPKDTIISIPRPEYPAVAKGARVAGEVKVRVVIGKSGRVVWARALNAHPLLKQAVLNAACEARFKPIKLSGRAVNVFYEISYNFALE
jgi:TonB family protein